MTTKQTSITMPEYDRAAIHALQAMALGTANDVQQKHALKWIIEQACGTYDQSFRPGDPHATNFAEGRRFSGLQIVKLLKLRPTEIEEMFRPKGVKK